eukprot:7668039-Alexandrium_andersonii.AAC.1
MATIMRGPIRRASFLKCRTEEEEKYLPIQIKLARAVPVTHEQRKFDGFEIDARAALKVIEKFDGNRTVARMLGRHLLRYVDSRHFANAEYRHL